MVRSSSDFMAIACWNTFLTTRTIRHMKPAAAVRLATWLDLNSAELALTQSQLLYHQSIYNFLTSKTELEALMGQEN